MMDDGVSPGDLGPPLVAMKARFPDRAKLRAQVWDAQVSNPATRMPPFGKHQALSEKEIDAIVDYLYTL
jgi:sulfur-oxidizing protein SoxX